MILLISIHSEGYWRNEYVLQICQEGQPMLLAARKTATSVLPILQTRRAVEVSCGRGLTTAAPRTEHAELSQGLRQL